MLAVTTALCADQVSASAPALRPQAPSLASRIVTRLTQSFGRTVADASRVQPGTWAVTQRTSPAAAFAPAPSPLPAHAPLSPFQFRLPPPAL